MIESFYLNTTYWSRTSSFVSQYIKTLKTENRTIVNVNSFLFLKCDLSIANHSFFLPTIESDFIFLLTATTT